MAIIGAIPTRPNLGAGLDLGGAIQASGHIDASKLTVSQLPSALPRAETQLVDWEYLIGFNADVVGPRGFAPAALTVLGLIRGVASEIATARVPPKGKVLLQSAAANPPDPLVILPSAAGGQPVLQQGNRLLSFPLDKEIVRELLMLNVTMKKDTKAVASVISHNDWRLMRELRDEVLAA